MKNIIANVLIVFLVLGLAGALAYAIYDNDRLNNVIENQNNFIKDITGKQSKFDKESAKYRDSITSYTKEITYLLNGKELSSDDFMKAYDNLKKERDSIRSVYDFAKSLYEFDVRRKRTSDTTYTLYQHGRSRADSAKIALKYFRDRIKVKNNTWYIDGTGKADLEKLEKDLNSELNKKLRPLLDSAKKTMDQQKQ